MFTVLETISFLLIDFIILAAVVAGIIFLILFVKNKKYKHKRVGDIKELESFKNQNLYQETDEMLKAAMPVAPTTFSHDTSNSYMGAGAVKDDGNLLRSKIPTRSSSNNNIDSFFQQQKNDADDLFKSQNETINQMNDTVIQNSVNTNYFNM